MKCFIYCRVSRDDSSKSSGDTRNSIKNQERICREYALSHDLSIVDTFLDNDVSGTLYPEQRPSMSRMWKRLSEIDCIVVLDASRTNRNTAVAEYILKGLVESGTDLSGASEGIDIKTPQGRMIFKIMNVVNENAVSVSRAKSISSQQDMAKKGELVLNPFTYGFRSSGRNKVEVVDHEAKIVKLIFDMCCKGKSTVHITRHLNDEGVKTRHGCSWRARTVWSLLRNPRFKGKIYLPKPLPEGVKKDRLDRERVLYDSPFPRLVSDETWEYAQISINSRSTGPALLRSSNLLSGVLKCYYCDCSFGFQRRVSKQSSYFCLGKHQKGSCSAISIHSSASSVFDNFFRSEIMKGIVVEEECSLVTSLLVERSMLTDKIVEIEENVLNDPSSASLLMKVHSNAESRIVEIDRLVSENKSKVVHSHADMERVKKYSSMSEEQKNQVLKQDAEILVIGEWFIASIRRSDLNSTHIGKFVRQVTYKSTNGKNMKAWLPTFDMRQFGEDIPELVLTVFESK